MRTPWSWLLGSTFVEDRAGAEGSAVEEEEDVAIMSSVMLGFLAESLAGPLVVAAAPVVVVVDVAASSFSMAALTSSSKASRYFFTHEARSPMTKRTVEQARMSLDICTDQTWAAWVQRA